MTETQLGSGTATASGGTGSIIIEWFDENEILSRIHLKSEHILLQLRRKIVQTVYTGCFLTQ